MEMEQQRKSAIAWIRSTYSRVISCLWSKLNHDASFFTREEDNIDYRDPRIVHLSQQYEAEGLTPNQIEYKLRPTVKAITANVVAKLEAIHKQLETLASKQAHTMNDVENELLPVVVDTLQRYGELWMSDLPDTALADLTTELERVVDRSVFGTESEGGVILPFIERRVVLPPLPSLPPM
jgi:hypothetical protein